MTSHPPTQDRPSGQPADGGENADRDQPRTPDGGEPSPAQAAEPAAASGPTVTPGTGTGRGSREPPISWEDYEPV